MADFPPPISDGWFSVTNDQGLRLLKVLAGRWRSYLRIAVFTSFAAIALSALFSWFNTGAFAPDPLILTVIWISGFTGCIAGMRSTRPSSGLHVTSAEALGRLSADTENTASVMMPITSGGQTHLPTQDNEATPDQAFRHTHPQASTKLEAELLQRTAELVEANEALQQKIVEQALAETRLRYDVFHDRLTNLPNRSLFSDRLTHSINRARRRGESGFAVLLFNIDRFRDVNDSLGLSAGDQLLISVSQRIREALRPGDTLARLGGDDFAILIENVSKEADAAACARRILALLEDPIKIVGREVFCSGSIGIAVNRSDYTDADAMLQDVNYALETAKTKVRSNYVLFEADMRGTERPRLEIETDLRRAVKKGDEFVLFYQPIIDLNTRRIVGFEALIRWQHPTRGLIGPGDFIAVAEDTGLIVQIGRWVLHEACAQLSSWQADGSFDAKTVMSINVSSRQLTDDRLVEDVGNCINAYNLDPGCLKLEVTESLLMEDPEAAEKILTELKALKVDLSIDDFGTGYSSLSYLHRFPFDYLKIDQSFVSQMTADQEITQIVRTIISLARGLQMDVIAEGVEDAETEAALLELSCHLVQGYHYSRPIEPNQVKYLASKIAKLE